MSNVRRHVNLPGSFVLALGLLLSGSQSFATPQTGCANGESVVFSCLIGGKTASVCLSPSSNLQYRFGIANKEPELAYPTKPDAENTAFRFGVESRSAKGSIANLQFSNSGITYAVVRFTHAFEANYAGIVIAKPNESLIRLVCKESSVVDNLWQPETRRLTPIPSSEIVE